MTQTADMSIHALAKAIRAREITSEAAVRDALDRIHRIDPSLGCFLQTFPERALDDAKLVDRRIAAGESVGSLAGVPVALKDNICLDYGRTTCASKILQNYESPFTATAAQRLIDAGAIIIGKTNLDEFAMGSSTEHSAFKPTRNPWDTSRVPGGSSGGSAAAVAARLVSGALGSDTGGSVRQPAALCGIVGVKPTYGRISRYGLVAYASSLDQIGTLTRSVEDAAAMLGVICAHDPRDSTSSDAMLADLHANLGAQIPELRIGVPREARGASSNHRAVNASLEEAIQIYKSLGAEIVDVELPHLKYGVAAYYIVAPAEASSNLARFDGVRYGHRAELKPGDDLIALYEKSRAEGFGPEVRQRIMLGTHALSSGYYDAYYLTALKVRRLIRRDFDHVFGLQTPGAPPVEAPSPNCHAILMPATPSPAFRLGEKSSDPLAMYLEDVYTVTVNLAGIPAISVPCGTAEVEAKRLPLGVQLLCPAFEEERMLRIAQMLEATGNWSGMNPGL